MPTPIGHALAGLAVAGIGGGTRLPRRDTAVLVLCACAPDLDLILRLVDGVNHHRGATHSLAAAAFAGLMAHLLGRLGARIPSPWLVGAAWASHVVLDYLGLDTSPPAGEMALWPFSEAFFISPVSLFYDIPRSFTPAAIRHNLMAVTFEVMVLGPLAWFCWRTRAAPEKP
jgi:inner membrane protein